VDCRAGCFVGGDGALGADCVMTRVPLFFFFEKKTCCNLMGVFYFIASRRAQRETFVLFLV
jgi:hypothetical protein